MPRASNNRLKVSPHISVEQKPNGYYYAIIKRNGRTPQEVSLKTKNREEAVAKVKDSKMEELAAHKWNGALTADVITRLTANRKLTIGEAAQNWLGSLELEGYAQSTTASTVYMLNRFIKAEKLGDEPVHALELRHVDHFVNVQIIDQKLSTRRRAAWAISAFCSAMFNNGLMVSNPASNLVIKTHDVSKDLLLPSERKPLTLTEIDKILAEAERGSFWWCAVQIVYETGLRLADVCNLQWSSFRGGYLELMTDKARVVVKHKVTPRLKEVLATIEKRSDTDFLFPEQEKQHVLSPSTLSQQFRRLCIKCGIMDRSFHSLRHTFALKKELEERETVRKQLLEEILADLALKNTQEAMGHKAVASTLHYLNHPKT